ncbi:MAG: acetate kinase [Cyanobacteriota bacterium]|nr:acetate kinase [Cyanobacteriota bacterium]
MGSEPLLVINAGSSSIKAALVETHDADSAPSLLWSEQRHWGGSAGTPASLAAALAKCLEPWLPAALEPWQQQLRLVGHRLVHGGSRFVAPTRLNADARAGLAAVASLAPLHNAVALGVVDWVEQWLGPRQPTLSQWACFDTAFHCTLTPEQSTYALPLTWRQQGLRRYGFHGLNHQHMAETVAAILHEEGRSSRELAELRLISAHLGAGCSLCAVKGGRSMATSMGLTPLEGLVMATRSGSVDPGLLLHQLQQGMSPAELSDTLQHRSGLLGLSGLSADMRELRQAAAAGHSGARLAIDVFTARLLEGIGTMAAVLQGVDVIALSGGIGQNDEQLAHTLHQELQWLGPFRLLQIPADEEGQIARQCLAAAQIAQS